MPRWRDSPGPEARSAAIAAATDAGIAVGRAQMTQGGSVVLDAEQTASRARDDSCAFLARRDARVNSGSTL